MSGIFISYRRGSSTPYARQIYERLSAAFGPERVFFDIDTVEVGADFMQVIESTIDRSALMVVVLDPAWASVSNPDGSLRLHDRDDPVRLEVSRGLARNITVIPVLVGGAAMPKAQVLPDDLKPLVRRNARELSDTRWKNDIEDLVQKAAGLIGVQPAVQRPSTHRPTGTRNVLLAVGGAGLLVCIAVVAFLLSGVFGSGDDDGSARSTSSMQLSADTTGMARQISFVTDDLTDTIAKGGDTGNQAEAFRQAGNDAAELGNEVSAELGSDDPVGELLTDSAENMIAASSDLEDVASDPIGMGARKSAGSAKENMGQALAALYEALKTLRGFFAEAGEKDAELTIEQSIRQLDDSREDLGGRFDALVAVVG